MKKVTYVIGPVEFGCEFGEFDTYDDAVKKAKEINKYNMKEYCIASCVAIYKRTFENVVVTVDGIDVVSHRSDSRDFITIIKDC